jgi:hypothetical protein
MQNKRKNPHHLFLRRLQAGGRTNMYGAVPYLANAFSLSREEAFRIVCDWIDLQAAEPSEPLAPVREPTVVSRPARRSARRAARAKQASRPTQSAKDAKPAKRAVTRKPAVSARTQSQPQPQPQPQSKSPRRARRAA